MENRRDTPGKYAGKLPKVDYNADNKALLEDYLSYCETIGRSPNTIKLYEANIRMFFTWNYLCNKDKDFKDITRREVIRYETWLKEVRKSAPSTIQNKILCCSSFGNYVATMLNDEAEFANYKNVFAGIQTPKVEAVREPSIFTIEELEAVLDKLVEEKKYRIACLLALAIYSGRRRNELLQFKVSYFTDENTICNGTLYYTPEAIQTKGKKLRVFVLKDKFKPYLDMYLEDRKAKGCVDTDVLFPRLVGHARAKHYPQTLDEVEVDDPRNVSFYGEQINEKYFNAGKPFIGMLADIVS